MAVWRADPKRRGQFVAGHAGPQRWIFRLEIGRHQDEGVMVPVGVWRGARPPIGVLFAGAAHPCLAGAERGRAGRHLPGRSIRRDGWGFPISPTWAITASILL